jgi:iron only hydrogenase large subunit-like protein
MKNPNIDYVLNYEELGAWFVALHIQVADFEGSEYEVQSSAEARNYGITGGVSAAVNSLLDEDKKAKSHIINGLDKAQIRDLKKFAKNGKCELGNLIEVMACPGGCLGGSSTINSFKSAQKQISEYINSSPDIKTVLKK